MRTEGKDEKELLSFMWFSEGRERRERCFQMSSEKKDEICEDGDVD